MNISKLKRQIIYILEYKQNFTISSVQSKNNITKKLGKKIEKGLDKFSL